MFDFFSIHLTIRHILNLFHVCQCDRQMTLLVLVSISLMLVILNMFYILFVIRTFTMTYFFFFFFCPRSCVLFVQLALILILYYSPENIFSKYVICPSTVFMVSLAKQRVFMQRNLSMTYFMVFGVL